MNIPGMKIILSGNCKLLMIITNKKINPPI